MCRSEKSSMPLALHLSNVCITIVKYQHQPVLMVQRFTTPTHIHRSGDWLDSYIHLPSVQSPYTYNLPSHKIRKIKNVPIYRRKPATSTSRHPGGTGPGQNWRMVLRAEIEADDKHDTLISKSGQISSYHTRKGCGSFFIL